MGATVSARALLAELEEVGVRLSLDGDGLIAEVRLGASIDPYRDRIKASKQALIVELLQRQIVAAVTVDTDQFDRAAYDRLWARWTALDAAHASEGTPA